MRRPWPRSCNRKWLLLLLPCAFAFPDNFNSSIQGPAQPSPEDRSLCGAPTCSLEALPYTLTYPFQDFVWVKTQTVVATVIPFVTVLSDGEVVTQSSTYLQYGPDPTDVVTWSPPQSSLLTWTTLGTTLTYPTTYVAYNPVLVLETTKTERTAKCVTRTTQIPLPAAATSLLVFPQTNRNPTPGFASVFSLLDTLPTVSAMLDGGDPNDCFQGLPPTTSALVITAQPNIPPAIISVYTTVSVLTHVADPITLAPDPIHGPPGSSTTTIPAEPNNAPPPATTTATALPEETAPANSPPPATPGGNNAPATTLATAPPAAPGGGAATVVAGVTISRGSSGAVVVDGVTLPAGAAATVGNVAVSVGSGGVVLVGGSSVDLPTAAAATTPSGGGAHPTSSATSGGVRSMPHPRTFRDRRVAGWIVGLSCALLFGWL